MAQLVITMVSLVILLASLYGLGTSSTIEIQTDSTQGMMNNQVNISCVPDGKEIIVMEIVKGEDNPIATIRHISDSISYGTGMKKNFQVEGHLSRDKAPDYLQLTITNPALSDLGRYQCVMFYVNGEGQLKEERINRNLTLEDLDILMLVNYLMTKVSNLEDTILDQKQTMEDQGTKLENWNKHLKKQENWNKVHEDLGNKLENQLNDQHDQLMNQHDQLLNQSHQGSFLLMTVNDMKRVYNITGITLSSLSDIDNLREVAEQRMEWKYITGEICRKCLLNTS